MFNPTAFENARPDGHAAMEVVGGDFVPLQGTTLTGRLVGPLANLSLAQVFTAPAGSAPLEVAYRFPLPGDAAVTGVAVAFADVVVTAQLAERGAATAEYEAAQAEGRQGALLTREAPEVFTLRVTGVAPGAAITVTTRYVQLARAEGAGWSLRVPLTTPPRYTRSDERGSRQAAGQPLAVLRDPGHRFALDLWIGAGEATGSMKLATTPEAGGLRVALLDGPVLPDRDLTLTWRPTRVDARPALDVFTHRTADWTYFLAHVAPPRAGTAPRRLPREAILLVDHSGSMSGAKWAAADWAVESFLKGLAPADTFALGLFHDQTYWHAKSPQPATPEAVGSALAYLKAETSDGGTELGVALEQALRKARAEGADVARHVLVVTDAQVTDEGRLLKLLDGEKDRRTSWLCIDAAPNDYLVHELAAAGRGTARFLTSDEDQADVTTALDAVLEDWAAPVATNLRLEVAASQVEATSPVTPGAVAGRFVLDLGDLPAARSVWVVGRFKGTDYPGFTLRAGDVAVLATATLGADTPDAGAGLAALFGARRVMGLAHMIQAGRQGPALDAGLRRLGYAPVAVASTVYAENAREAAHAALKDLLVAESLAYGVACSETAFVATRTEAGQPIAGTVVVGSALPANWSDGFALGGRGGGGGGGMFGAGAPMMSMMAPSPMSPEPMMDAMDFEISDDAPPPAVSRPKMKAKKSAPRQDFEQARREDVTAPAFDGVPVFTNGEATLLDATDGLPGRLSTLSVALTGGSADPETELLLYVDDMDDPRARVRLADVLARGGQRPLNVAVPPGTRVRLVLVDTNGAWPAGARLTVGWA